MVEAAGKLVRVVGETSWEEFPLPVTGTVTIGRDARRAEVVLDEVTVSREHATIFFSPPDR